MDVPQIHEETVEVGEFGPTRTRARADRRDTMVEVLIPQIVEENVDVVRLVPQERTQRIDEQVVEVRKGRDQGASTFASGAHSGDGRNRQGASTFASGAHLVASRALLTTSCAHTAGAAGLPRHQVLVQFRRPGSPRQPPRCSSQYPATAGRE